MQSVQTSDHPLQGTSTLRDEPPSSMRELLADDGLDRVASRCEPQMLIAGTKPTDPYTTWLNQREAERRSATATALPRTAGRFGRNQAPRAPWNVILVKLSTDGR
jgi:hypothetical protein